MGLSVCVGWDAAHMEVRRQLSGGRWPSFHHVGPENGTQVIRLGRKCRTTSPAHACMYVCIMYVHNAWCCFYVKPVFCVRPTWPIQCAGLLSFYLLSLLYLLKTGFQLVWQNCFSFSLPCLLLMVTQALMVFSVSL